MGMDYFIFKVGVTNDIEVRTYNSINKGNTEYINYNKFLRKEYFIDIDENDDFIPMIKKDKAIIILRKDQFKITDLENVFEVLLDSVRNIENHKDKRDYVVNI